MKSSLDRARVVIANSTLLGYQRGGGHWMIRIQWMLGLRDLGHEVLLLEFTRRSPTPEELRGFFARLESWGLADSAVVVLCDNEHGRPIRYYGLSRAATHRAIASCDFLWNDCAMLRGPLLHEFDRRVLIDLDPGHLQVSALEWDMELDAHQVHLTVGSNILETDCEVPRLGHRWTPVFPPVHLPLWRDPGSPSPDAPISSITHWEWGELDLNGRRLSISKREAYLRYLDLPRQVSVPLELAVHFDQDDVTGDPDLLLEHGWRVVDPWCVVGDPNSYRGYIYRSLGELSCPKPIFRELRTGWFSDRSACYLAAGRPVLAEDTGFTPHLPTGEGLVTFGSVEEAEQKVSDIHGHWEVHSRAARALAEEYFDARRVLQAMIEASAA